MNNFNLDPITGYNNCEEPQGRMQLSQQNMNSFNLNAFSEQNLQKPQAQTQMFQHNMNSFSLNPFDKANFEESQGQTQMFHHNMNNFSFNPSSGQSFEYPQGQMQTFQSPSFSSCNYFPMNNEQGYIQPMQLQRPQQFLQAQWNPYLSEQIQAQWNPYLSQHIQPRLPQLNVDTEQLHWAQPMAQTMQPHINLHQQRPQIVPLQFPSVQGQHTSQQQSQLGHRQCEPVPGSTSLNRKSTSSGHKMPLETPHPCQTKKFVSLKELEVNGELPAPPKDTEIIIVEDNEEEPSPTSIISPKASPSVRALKKPRKEYSWLQGHELKFEDALRQNVQNIQIDEIKNAATARAQLTKKKTPEKQSKTDQMGSKYKEPKTNTKRSKAMKKNEDTKSTEQSNSAPASPSKGASEACTTQVQDLDKENMPTPEEVVEYEALFDAGEDKENITPAEEVKDVENYDYLFEDSEDGGNLALPEELVLQEDVDEYEQMFNAGE